MTLSADESHRPAPRPQRRQQGLILLIIFAAAALARLWGLSLYMPSMDEVQFFIMSGAPDLGELWERARAENHPPLLWILRHFLLPLSPEPADYRILSVWFGLAAGHAVYLLGRQAGGRALGLAACFIFLFLPASVIMSVSLRNYALFMALQCWALLLLYRRKNEASVRHLALFSLLQTLACFTHFASFIIAASIGLAEGLHLLRRRHWRGCAALCAAYIPPALAGLFIWAHYMGPGGSFALWSHFMIVTGFTDPNAPHGFMEHVFWPVYSYFCPLLLQVYTPGFVSPYWVETAQSLVLLGGMLMLAFYGWGLVALHRLAPRLVHIILAVWFVSLAFSALGIYPFSANRHSLYLLPFFALPVGAALLPVAALLSKPKGGPALAAMLAALAGWGSHSLIAYDPDFALTRADYAQAQTYLNGKLKPDDAIVTGPMGAYFYLIWEQDRGKTPYHTYRDVPYGNGVTIAAPFGSPYKPYSDWRPFYDDLKTRFTETALPPQVTVWFVQYDWRNQEIWMLMQCPEARAAMHRFFSLDGVAIFAMRLPDLQRLLADAAAWERCYQGYKPLIVGTPFKQIQATDLPPP